MSKVAVVRDDVLYCPEGSSLTHQEFQDSCDIRNIMTQYKRQGLNLPLVNFDDSILDYSELPDYQAAMDLMVAAQNSFDSLPALVRKRFNNDPAQFVDFVFEPGNEQELVKMGLATAKQEPLVNTKNSAVAESDPSST